MRSGPTDPGAESVVRPRLAPLLWLAGAVMAGAALGLVPTWPGLIHAVALPPLGLVADLSGALGSTNGLLGFVAVAIASLALRTVVLAAVLGGLDRRRLGLALRFNLIVWPLAFVAAALLYAAGAILFYLLFWAGVVVAVALALGTGAAPWLATGGRLRSGFAASARSGLRAGTLGAYVVVLCLIGYVADVGGDAVAIAMVLPSALATWATAVVLVTEPGWRWARRSVAGLGAAGAGALVAVVVTGPAGPAEPADDTEPLEGSIMLMSGIDSGSGSGAILELDPRTFGWTCEQTWYFSYAGPGHGQPRNEALCEIDHGAPYEAPHTLRSRDDLVPELDAQAEGMISPGIVAGHSQGAWITWEAAARERLGSAEAIVLVGPFPDNPVAYPAAEDAGFGHVGRAVIAFVAEADRPGGTSVFETDSPLGREWLGDPDAITETFATGLPGGTRALNVPSTFDLPLTTASRDIPGAEQACPVAVIHPNLPYSGEFHEAVARFARGEPQPACPWWRSAVGPLLAHFSAPPAPW